MHAGTGRLNVIVVGVLAFLAAMIGDNIGFAVGHFGGQRLVERFGRYILLTPERLAKATGFFERHGGKVVTIARVHRRMAARLAAPGSDSRSCRR